jgi:hypothetical protein
MSLVRKSLLTLSLLLLLSPNSMAALVASTGPIANLRLEGNWGFIGLTQPMQPASTCVGRVWVDMTTTFGRSVYATAMMALATNQTAVIRAFEESPLVFGACQLYDIYVQP